VTCVVATIRGLELEVSPGKTKALWFCNRFRNERLVLSNYGERLRAFAVSAGRAGRWDAPVMHRGDAIKAPAWSSDLHSGSDSQSSQSPAG
jgi:hypothetical protein